MRTTLKDIAKELSLTESAVSMALRGYPNISSATIKRVQSKAREMGYRPNLAARNLRQNNPKVVGVVLGDMVYNFSQNIINGAKHALHGHNYIPMLAITAWNKEQEQRDIDCLLGYQIEAFICNPMAGSEYIYRRLLEMNLPLVFVGSCLDMPGTSWVGLDSYDGAKQVMNHLVELGHRRIGIVITDSTYTSFSLSSRLRAYREVLAENGVEFDPTLVAETRLGDLSSVEEAVQKLISLEKRPTAIFTVTDIIAYEVMNTLMRNNLKIPGDVALAGMGNLAPSEFEAISLTSVSEDGFAIGARAAEAVIARLEDPEAKPIREPIPGKLQIRRSTAGKVFSNSQPVS